MYYRVPTNPIPKAPRKFWKERKDSLPTYPISKFHEIGNKGIFLVGVNEIDSIFFWDEVFLSVFEHVLVLHLLLQSCFFVFLPCNSDGQKVARNIFKVALIVHNFLTIHPLREFCSLADDGMLGDHDSLSVRLRKRKRKPPPQADEFMALSQVGGWIRLGLGWVSIATKIMWLVNFSIVNQHSQLGDIQTKIDNIIAFFSQVQQKWP